MAANIHQIRLENAQNGTISSISLYSGEAEITRIFNLHLKDGLNRVTIDGLSPSLRQDTLRVEGQGLATINDVVVAKPSVSRGRNNVPTDPMLYKRLETNKALESARDARQMLTSYLNAVTPKDIPITDINGVLNSFAVLTEQADKRVMELEKAIGDIDEEISKQPTPSSVDRNTGRTQISVLLDAEAESEVKLVLRYVVFGADWAPSYDIRVDTSKETDNITITYKALVVQDTGEDWDSTPLVLETVKPSFAGSPARLYPWTLSVAPPVHAPSLVPAAPVVLQMPRREYRSRDRDYSRASLRGRSPSPPYPSCYRSATPRSATPVAYREIPTSDKGGFAATFQVPGRIGIPSDGAQHHVTIATMKLDAKIHWYAIPKRDQKVYLTARIKNNAPYTFVPGNAHIFVDGSFVASTTMPAVSPEENFDCPLGSDPAVKITYHPDEQRASSSGIVSRSSIRAYTQRITIQNTKSVSVEDLKIIENVPISQDERIIVKLVSPALPVPLGLHSTGWSVNAPPIQNVRKPLKLGDWVHAQWDKADEEDVEDAAVGKEGKINWLLAVPPRQTVNLVLQFEVAYPNGVSVAGLVN